MDDTQPKQSPHDGNDTDIFCNTATWPHPVPEHLKVELVMKGPLGLQNRSEACQENTFSRS